MPTFTYKAKDSKGALIQGVMEAEARPAVVARLQTMGLFPLSIEGGGGRGKAAGSAAAKTSSGGAMGQARHLLQSGQRRIRTSDMSSFNRQMADLLGAGIPLVKALSILVVQTPNERLREILSEINSDVQGGDTFATALSKHPRIFNPLYVAMVRAGEAGGMLDAVLQRLADFSEQEEALKGKIKSALAYPVVMIVAGIGAVIVMMTVVIPKIVKIFQDLNQALPTPTKILIASSDFLTQYWWLVAGILAVAWSGFWRFIKTAEGRRYWHRIQLQMPLLGIIIRKKEVARFSRTLGALLHNGVPILSALDIVKEVALNVWVKSEVDKIVDNVTQGAGVAKALKGGMIFPPVVVSMINIGEETGRLDEVLRKVADSFEIEVDRSVKTMTSLIEPLIIVFMAFLVGFIVISMLLPIFTLDPTAGDAIR
jgi:type II secretion system protein F